MDCATLLIISMGIGLAHSLKMEVSIKADANLTAGTNPARCPPDRKCPRNTKTAIVGGCVVKPRSLPWQVVIVYKNELDQAHCGGTVICPKFVLTAAHCFTRLDPEDPIEVCICSVCVSIDT